MKYYPQRFHANGSKVNTPSNVAVALSSMGALKFNIVLPQVSEEYQLSYAQISRLSS